MSTVFADSFYFIAQLNPADEAHGKATAFTTDALTGDHHFEQAGFIALLK
jgi:hypothetical protein